MNYATEPDKSNNKNKKSTLPNDELLAVLNVE
jgi:hypothetical protein